MRIATGPWDACFGGQPGPVGTVRSGVTLIGGTWGSGKSTFAMQWASSYAQATDGEVLYLGTEESGQEIRLRAERLGVTNLHQIRVMEDMAQVFTVLSELEEASVGPKGIVLDSYTGAVGDNREMSELVGKLLKKLAVKFMAHVLCIDQITKDDALAGPMARQHGVDTVLALQLDMSAGERILYTLKNRFGPAQVQVFFTMGATGLSYVRTQMPGDPKPKTKKAGPRLDETAEEPDEGETEDGEEDEGV